MSGIRPVQGLGAGIGPPIKMGFTLSLVDRKASTINPTDFHPSRLAAKDEKRALMNDPDFLKLVPSQWEEVEEVEKRIYLRWARRLGSDVEDYDFLFLSHTANHANFLKPHFYIKEDHSAIPYSIDRSAHLCSCCLELFQVLGSRYPKNLVAPCPGATIFAGLKPDQYMLVEKAQ